MFDLLKLLNSAAYGFLLILENEDHLISSKFE